MKYPCDGCVLSNHCRGNCEDLNKWIRVAKDAVEKQNKYSWHDLRKNPDDLPDDGVHVYVCYESEEYDVAYISEWYDVFNRCEVKAWYSWWSDEYICDVHNNSEVIAWKEIEPFGEV